VCPPQGICIRPPPLGGKMKKYECKVCVPTSDKCILIVPDDLREPERCPIDSMRAKWRQVIRVEVVSNGVASRL